MGLRERKRLETRTALEEAAVTVVLRDGFEHATVDAMCAEANVSPRTFFNYFESKEDAILCVYDEKIDDARLTAHVRNSLTNDLIESVVALVVSLMGPAATGRSHQKSRIEIIKKNPHLLSRHAAQITRMNEHLVKGIRLLLSADSRFSSDSAAEQEEEAELLLAVSGGALRIAVREWIADDGNSDNIQARAAELIRKVITTLNE